MWKDKLPKWENIHFAHYFILAAIYGDTNALSNITLATQRLPYGMMISAATLEYPGLSPQLNPQLTPRLTPRLSPRLSPRLNPRLTPGLNPGLINNRTLDELLAEEDTARQAVEREKAKKMFEGKQVSRKRKRNSTGSQSLAPPPLAGLTVATRRWEGPQPTIQLRLRLLNTKRMATTGMATRSVLINMRQTRRWEWPQPTILSLTTSACSVMSHPDVKPK